MNEGRGEGGKEGDRRRERGNKCEGSGEKERERDYNRKASLEE